MPFNFTFKSLSYYMIYEDCSPRAGSGVERIDPLRFLAGLRQGD